MVTIRLEDDQARELLIALRDRAFTLIAEVNEGRSGKPGAASIANIAQRQLDRVMSFGPEIAAQLGESF